MDVFLGEWLNLLLRWAHMVVGIGWIGTSFYFMALDYTLALRKREQLNAAADAAAIAAVRPAMLTQTDSAVVQATATAVFAAKANLAGLKFSQG